MIQGTKEWHMARLGKVTASQFAVLLGKARSKSQPFSDGAMTYLYTLVSERLTGIYADEVDTFSTRWGKELEEAARGTYQWQTGNNIATYGFVKLNENVGGSPDGVIIDQDGIVEIKCPWTSKEHVRTLATGEVPKQYIAQVQGNLWVTGRSFCDFVSFDNRFPAGLWIKVVRVERDDEYIATLAKRVEEFAALVISTEKEVRRGEKSDAA